MHIADALFGSSARIKKKIVRRSIMWPRGDRYYFPDNPSINTYTRVTSRTRSGYELQRDHWTTMTKNVKFWWEYKWSLFLCRSWRKYATVRRNDRCKFNRCFHCHDANRFHGVKRALSRSTSPRLTHNRPPKKSIEKVRITSGSPDHKEASREVQLLEELRHHQTWLTSSFRRIFAFAIWMRWPISEIQRRIRECIHVWTDHRDSAARNGSGRRRCYHQNRRTWTQTSTCWTDGRPDHIFGKYIELTEESNEEQSDSRAMNQKMEHGHETSC